MTTQLNQERPFGVTYDVAKYDFRKIVRSMLDTHDLTQLHAQKSYAVLDRKHDQSTHWHRLYYDHFDQFCPLYLQLLREHIMPLFGLAEGTLVYQVIPTFRAHLVGNLGVGAWHKDRDYNHGDAEINFWMPFTDTYDTNTLWLESEEGKGDFKAYSVKYGEILVFRGAVLTHGNKINKTPHSRVSVDFRLLKLSHFQPTDKTSINTGSKFSLGGYFSSM
jgi:hypothetical protein